MRIVVISDIHGNLDAFKAVLLNLKDIDGYFFLGDYIGDGPYVNEVLDLMFSLENAYYIKGNREVMILDYLNGKYPEWTNSIQMQPTVYAANQVSPKNKEKLEQLNTTLEIVINNKKVCLAHGSPRDERELLYEDNEMINAYLDRYDLLCVGHSHLQFKIEKNSTILNPGTIGFNTRNKPKPEYAVVTIDEQIQVEFFKINYNFKKYLSELYSQKYLGSDIWAKLIEMTQQQGKLVNIEFLNDAVDTFENITNESMIATAKRWKII